MFARILTAYICLQRKKKSTRRFNSFKEISIAIFTKHNNKIISILQNNLKLHQYETLSAHGDTTPTNQLLSTQYFGKQIKEAPERIK